MLDLSATFDSTNHNILVNHFSSWHTYSSALNWFTSYLSPGSF